ncbi:hypothetical protein EB796_006926 [Bugula neritina]|uniref:Uncharacterized protein n=1 Tax=Bugula neritina TaxID=10212 RepID=A0A7J7K937_BUGNE|nr:hypothetical protein EB796_006926 [Bugula neritina]
MSRFLLKPDSGINGGKVSNGGSNWPLRGEKGTVYEGGTRGVTFINSPLLQNRGYVHDGLFHAIDWTPTLLHFAEGTTPINSIFDGVDQFDMLTTGSPSKRTSFLYEINRGAAIRDGDYKLIVGFSGNFDGYSAQPGATSASVTSAVRKKRMAGRAFSRRLRRRRQMGASNRGPGRRTPGSGARNQGGRNLGGRNQGNQRQRNSKQLFNLKDDPSETRDLSAMFPRRGAEIGKDDRLRATERSRADTANEFDSKSQQLQRLLVPRLVLNIFSVVLVTKVMFV